MSLRKKPGYNWKARQRKAHSNGGGSEGMVPQEEGLSESDAFMCWTGVGPSARGADSNALVLPSKRKKTDGNTTEPAPKRKKLSAKQKKRLQKIVEAKERKAQVCDSKSK